MSQSDNVLRRAGTVTAGIMHMRTQQLPRCTRRLVRGSVCPGIRLGLRAGVMWVAVGLCRAPCSGSTCVGM